MSNKEIDVNALSEVVNDKADRDLGNLTEEGDIKLGKGGIELCDIGMALYVDETKGLRRYLNGQIVDINTNTQAFLNRLKEIKSTNPDYFTTEDNWQAEALLNIDGCVYKFVLNYSGDNVVSVRLPKYPDYVEINAGGTLPVFGNGMALGITDGTHNHTVVQDTVGRKDDDYGLTASTSALGSPVGSASANYASDMSKVLVGITTDSTKSGIETTLKQTKLKMRYFIQIATGSETEANIVNTLENVNGFTLLESKYSDKPLYNESWLLSNGQWNAKAVYPTVYEGLQVEYNTEIEAGTTVTLPSGVSYTKRGLSVKLSTEEYTDYDFVINTTDEMFKLPLSNNQRFVIETYTDGVNGYRIWSDGYCEQWGFAQATNSSDITVNIDLFKSYIDTDYNFISSNQYKSNDNTAAGFRWSCAYEKKTTSTVTVAMLGLDKVYGRTWTARGYLASGEYTPQNLYYYVGDLDQNHGIVNMGRIGEVLATKTDMLQASGAGMPSGRYIDLTLGASGSTYTAPADGCFRLVKKPTATGQYIMFSPIKYYNGQSSSDQGAIQVSPWTEPQSIMIPVLKGDQIYCYYDFGGETIKFEFRYAEGDQ